MHFKLGGHCVTAIALMHGLRDQICAACCSSFHSPADRFTFSKYTITGPDPVFLNGSPLLSLRSTSCRGSFAGATQPTPLLGVLLIGGFVPPTHAEERRITLSAARSPLVRTRRETPT